MNILKYLKDLFSKIYDIFTPGQRTASIIVFILIVIGSLLEMLGVTIIVPLVQVILIPEDVLQNAMYRPLWDVLHVESTRELVLWISAGTIGIYIVKNVYMSFLSYYKNQFYNNTEKETTLRLMNSYLRREYTFHINTNSSVLLRSIVYDVAGVTVTLTSLFLIVIEGMSTIFILVVLFAIDFRVASTLAISALVALLLTVATFHRVMEAEGERVVTYNKLCLKAVNESFNGVKDVLVTRRQRFFEESYADAAEGKTKSNAVKGFAAETPAYVIEGICITVFIVMLCVLSLTGQRGEIFVSNAAAFAVAAFRILPSVGKIINNYNIITYHQAMVDNVRENIHELQEYEENKARDQLITNRETEDGSRADNMVMTGFQNVITLEHVSWKYPNAEQYVIKDLDMTIRKGQAIGFIGTSGAGKTTLADMILGLLPTQTGKITMDGRDIREIPKLWSRTIGYVPQSVYLTDDTIRNNVAFGIRQEEIDDGDIWKALEQAQLKTFVEGLPEGLDTIVGEQGIKFSGGQRQRVAIARALYCDPDILVLDEATSALDNETETAIMEAIESLQGHKTLIIVAHRLTTIRSCDAVYEIADGKAVLQKKMS